MNVSSKIHAKTEYSSVTATQPQKAKPAVFCARSLSSAPSARAITLAPPTPNRFEIADRNMNAGMHTVTAVIIASLPVRPMKNVSAILYTTRMIWLMTVGTASFTTAFHTGQCANKSSFSASFILDRPPR